MYLGLVVLTLGIAVWAGTWPMMIVPFAVFATANWVHIPFEEAKMRRQFGASYDDYVSRVSRWLYAPEISSGGPWSTAPTSGTEFNKPLFGATVKSLLVLRTSDNWVIPNHFDMRLE